MNTYKTEFIFSILLFIVGCSTNSSSPKQDSPRVSTPVTVTKPLENAIKRVPNLKTVRSITSRGNCEISAFIEWNADIDLSKQQIESSINQIKDELPVGTSLSIEKMNSSILPVIGYIIEGKGRSNIELNQIANYTVKPFLSQAVDVAEVWVIGGKTKEYHIELLPYKMAALGVTPAKVTAAFSQTNYISSNGYLTDYNRLYLTVTDAILVAFLFLRSAFFYRQ